MVSSILAGVVRSSGRPVVRVDDRTAQKAGHGAPLPRHEGGLGIARRGTSGGTSGSRGSSPTVTISDRV